MGLRTRKRDRVRRHFRGMHLYLESGIV